MLIDLEVPLPSDPSDIKEWLLEAQRAMLKRFEKEEPTPLAVSQVAAHFRLAAEEIEQLRRSVGAYRSDRDEVVAALQNAGVDAKLLREDAKTFTIRASKAIEKIDAALATLGVRV